MRWTTDSAHRLLPHRFPSRPERDRDAGDVADTELPEIAEIARAHGIHPALVCLKWAVQRGQIPIPFSVKEPQYRSNLQAVTEDPYLKRRWSPSAGLTGTAGW